MQTAKLGKYEVAFDDSVEFHTLKREIWGSHCYYIELETESPHILDLGAHIGLTSLYFKTLFPNCTVDAYEPSHASCELFRTNLEWNNVKGVTLHELAVSPGEKELVLHQNQDGLWRSTISVYPGAWNESQETTPEVHKAIPFKNVLETHYDLIKMDVEGLEYDLVASAKQALTTCNNWLIEIHGVGHYDIRDLISIFEKAGFTVYLEKGGKKIKSHQLSGLALLHASRGGVKQKS